MLTVRRLGFEFPDDIPFYFNPRNPLMSVRVNMFTFLAPAFERYFIQAIREAMPRIKTEAVKDEAELFCRQEGQHAKVHIDHQELLLRKYPQLEEARDLVNRSYAKLRESESNDFALAYATTIELWFKPTANFFARNRRVLFHGGDPRISSFFLWHFVEEYEHRHSMYTVYQDLVGSYWYRVKTARRTIQHVNSLATQVARAVVACERPPKPDPELERIPRWKGLALTLTLLETLSPFHDPDRGGEPDWARRWYAAERAGADMRAVTF